MAVLDERIAYYQERAETETRPRLVSDYEVAALVLVEVKALARSAQKGSV